MIRRAAILVSLGLLWTQAAWSQSSVTLYGRLGEDINYTHFSGAGKNPSQNGTTVDSDASFWGMRMRENLGGGTSVFAKMENGFNLNNGSLFKNGYMFNRQAYIGLQNNTYGSIFLGRQYAPEFFTSIHVDPFGRLSNGSMLSLFQAIPGGSSRGFVTGISNSIQYWTPMIMGFRGKLMYALSNGGTAASSTIGEAEGASLVYRNRSLYVSLSYNNQRIANTEAGLPSLSNSTYQLGATYDFRVVKVYGYVMRNDQRNQPKAYGYLLGLSSYINPSNEVMFSAAKRSSPTPQSGAEMFALGINHFLSKRTIIYGSVAHLSNEGNAKYSLWPALISYKTENLPMAGQNETSVMVGIRHYF